MKNSCLTTQEYYAEEKMEPCSCGKLKAIFFCDKEPPCNGQLTFC